jgi:hypothetical protein
MKRRGDEALPARREASRARGDEQGMKSLRRSVSTTNEAKDTKQGGNGLGWRILAAKGGANVD